MKNKKHIKLIIVLLIMIVVNIGVLSINDNSDKPIEVTYTTLSDKIDTYQVYYSNTEEFGENQTINQEYMQINQPQEMKYNLPKETKFIRMDLGGLPGNVWLKDVKIKYDFKYIFLDNYQIESLNKSDDISNIVNNNGWVTMNSIGNDPFITLDLTNVLDVAGVDRVSNMMKILMCLFIDIIFLVCIKFKNKIRGVLKENYNNRYLIWNLSINDFKTKYAGSYLGIFWAFVQPVVTTLIYWFVFDFGFKAAPATPDTPFILWLVVGIIPWFFFSEAIMNATNSLLEYSYLVKKVVFKISILPVIKMLSSFFIHIFFVSIALLIFILYRHIPSIHIIQIIYYMFCTFILALSISYITSAVVIFFRDLGQIINVVLQIGMWLTPIMWNKSMLSEKYHWILKLNPIYYIVEGYRDSFINKIWFWEKYLQTTYFWIATMGCFLIGIVIFKKLKNHFADVL